MFSVTTPTRIIFPYLHNLETKQDIADYFDLTLAASTDPATPYTIHNKSGLDDDGQTCAK